MTRPSRPPRPSRDQWARNVMSGADRSPAARATRLATAAAEPAYAAVMRLRNALYDAGLKRATPLGRPTVSVGNLTTGGTGKTPVVRWLAQRLLDHHLKPAILLRGYKVGSSTQSDEQSMLSQALGDRAVVEAGPSRLDSAARVLAKHPDVSVFLLDDAFQHRKIARDFDLLLVNAPDPFGFDHVLPRGLLREPLPGLRRASAILLTRADQVPPATLASLEQTIRRHTPAPLYHAAHAHVGLRSPTGTLPIDSLHQSPFFAFAGIGNPDSLAHQLQGPAFAGHHWFPDHHDYSPQDLATLAQQAARAGATRLLTTEKDWVKLSHLPPPPLPILRLDLDIHLPPDHATRLLTQILQTLP